MKNGRVYPKPDDKIALHPLTPLNAPLEHIDEASAIARARSLIADGDADLAEQFLREWLADNLGVWAEAELCKLEQLRGDYAGALERFERMSEAFPAMALGFSGQIEVLLNTGRFEEAEAIAERALAQFPSDTWLWDISASLAERAGKPVLAFQRWKAIRAYNPQHDRAFAGMVRNLAALGNLRLITELTLGKDVVLDEGVVGDLDYRSPSELARTATRFRRGLVIGSCLTAGWPEIFANLKPSCEADFVQVNNLSRLPLEPPRALESYDFQIVQLPLRTVMPDKTYFNLNFDAPEEYEQAYHDACDRIAQMVSEYLRWNVETGLLTFVCNFLTPQQNSMGRLQPRYDLRNPVYFIERLNQFLSEEINQYKNAFLLDLDQISATIGRRYVQDDMVWITGHGSVLSSADFEHDGARLEALQPVDTYYPGRIWDFCRMIWREIEANFRTVNQIDVVKLVLFDLDDTLWRGVRAETGQTTLEGWPLGLVEALLALKRRGIILGIVSKNNESRIVELWREIFSDLLPIDTFAVRKINWSPKAENIAEILEDVNLLPGNVLFIDDNPVERAAVKQAFPEIRVLGANPYLWRRILLWSAETQVPTVTAESARRSEMIQAQVTRERQRKVMPRDEFLATLEVNISIHSIKIQDDPAFPRAFELINKTNQFNTTGSRWTIADVSKYFESGGAFYALYVVDKFTDYGLVGVLCVRGGVIDQFVLSCRVIGLDVEIAAVAVVLDRLTSGGAQKVEASAIETPVNLLSRDIWSRCGFERTATGYQKLLLQPLAVPQHVSIRPLAFA